MRPILLPIWRLVRPYVQPGRPARRPPGTPPPPVVAKPPPPGTIRPLTRREFLALEAEHRYYRGRWQYLSVAGDAARSLIKRHRLHSALELGPNIRSLIVNADVMDLRDYEGLEAEGRVILHDAREAPWPIGDKAYDLFVALQVFEHLKGGQVTAFREVRRVARHAILSLPIDWDMHDPNHSHHMISHEQVLSWFHPIVPTRVLVGNPGPKARMVYVFEDLPA